MLKSNTARFDLDPLVGGIYTITNLETREQYIGRAKSVFERWKQHRTRLRHGKHHNRLLQAAWTVAGDMGFRFDLIESVPVGSSLDEAERRWVQLLRPKYNIPNRSRRVNARADRAKLLRPG